MHINAHVHMHSTSAFHKQEVCVFAHVLLFDMQSRSADGLGAWFEFSAWFRFRAWFGFSAWFVPRKPRTSRSGDVRRQTQSVVTRHGRRAVEGQTLYESLNSNSLISYLSSRTRQSIVTRQGRRVVEGQRQRYLSDREQGRGEG